MKWGIRRYQNGDGTLTEEGRNRYYKVKEAEQLGKNYAKAQYNYYGGKKASNKISKDVEKAANDVTKAYNKFYKSNDNPKAAKKLADKFCKENGFDRDEIQKYTDEDDIRLFLSDQAYDSRGVRKAYKNHEKAYNQALNQYNSVDNQLISKATREFGDVEVKSGLFGKTSSALPYITKYLNNPIKGDWESYRPKDVVDYYGDADEDLQDRLVAVVVDSLNNDYD